MANLTQIIPQQNFELIRDRIGVILKDEITEQVNLSGNQDINAAVFSEKFTPFDKTDFPCINVLLSRGSYDPITPQSDTGDYTFFIDAYTSAKSTNLVGGDAEASFRLQRILGVCRSILRSPFYGTLLFPTPLIGHTSVSDIQIMEPNNNQDATSAIWGRLVFRVKCTETTELQTALELDSFKTQVKLNLTDKGYLYEIN